MRKSIAVVEDNEDNRALLRAILEDQYDITDYDSGAAALEGLKAAPPDLVLLDISMPGMDGAEVLSRLRADGALASLKVIALTAHAMAGDREKYLSKGFDAYVTKPILDEKILFAAIEEQLR